MFVSASLLLDYRAQRPAGSVRPLTTVRRGLSVIVWNDERGLGRERAVDGDRGAGGEDAIGGELGVVAFELGWGEVAEGGVPAAVD